MGRYAVLFEQKWIADIDIDYEQDQRWGWIPNGWRVTEMLADGSRRLVSEATVSSYSINQPISIQEFKSSECRIEWPLGYRSKTNLARRESVPVVTSA